MNRFMWFNVVFWGLTVLPRSILIPLLPGEWVWRPLVFVICFAGLLLLGFGFNY